MTPLLLAAALASVPPPPPPPPPSNECVPTCRDGYVCSAGACVSACNPMCGAGEVCTASGQCLPPPPAGPIVSQDGSERARPGTHFEMRRTRGLIAGGVVSLSVGWAISSLYSVIAFDNSQAVGYGAGVGFQEGMYLVYLIPLVGPVMGRGMLSAKYGGALSGAFDWAYSIAMSVSQVAGLAMLVLGARETEHLVSDRTSEVVERTRSPVPVRLAIAPGAPGAPVGLTFTLTH